MCVGFFNSLHLDIFVFVLHLYDFIAKRTSSIHLLFIDIFYYSTTNTSIHAHGMGLNSRDLRLNKQRELYHVRDAVVSGNTLIRAY